MADPSEKSTEFPLGNFEKLPFVFLGSTFFVTQLSYPSSLKPDKFEDFVEFVLNEGNFSPYPAEQLAWGYQADEGSGRIFIFATPFPKLRQLGWQDLEYFRRVFPSFISLLGKEYTEPTLAFMLFEDTLSAGAFQPDSNVPDLLYSLALDEDER